VKESYDIIVIGTGIGGGIVAGDLFDTNSKLGVNAKSVLAIEKGGLNIKGSTSAISLYSPILLK